MSFAMQPMALDLALPWQQDPQNEQAFQRILKRVLITLLVLFIVVPFLPVVDLGYQPDDDAPVRTLVLLDPLPEPEPVVPPEPEPVKAQPKPAPKPVAPAPTAEPVASKPAAETSAQSEPEPAPKVDLRETLVQSQGLSDLTNQLNAVRNTVNVASLQNKNLTRSEAGEVARAERARLGQELANKSTGVVVDETVMQGEITILSAHESAEVAQLALNSLPEGRPGEYTSNQVGRRDMESIRRTLEQAKGNVYALYQQALLQHPGLTGEFTFRLVIDPNGVVSDLRLLVSELGLSELESSILERIKSVDFGPMDVPPTVVEYRFVFLPS